MSHLKNVSCQMIRFINIIVLLKIVETGVPLQLVPFRESAHAVRLVPNTPDLNEFVDRTLESIKRFTVENTNPLTVNSVYKYFLHQTPQKSVPVVFKTSEGVVRDLTDMRRSGNAYIYNNEVDSIQLVAKLLLNPLTIEYERYNVTGEFKESGRVTGRVNSSEVDVWITLRVRQNNSRPLVCVCDGKVDRLSLTPGDVRFDLTDEHQEIHSEILNVLRSHFNSDVFPQLSKFLSSSLETVVGRDEQLCYSLVLCNSCEFYAADF